MSRGALLTGTRPTYYRVLKLLSYLVRRRTQNAWYATLAGRVREQMVWLVSRSATRGDG
jgi:hypothetical protein